MRDQTGQKKVSKNVVVMGLVSLFNDISSEMVYPIVPIFLATVLKAPATAIGLIEGVAESTASLLKLVSGWLSDRLKKRKIFVSFGYG
ncbi:MAG TPA: MFS transporter, partial [Patescibacteria group bacterium]|nr:MFS transporter [Patescibacteria group bacterium]